VSVTKATLRTALLAMVAFVSAASASYLWLRKPNTRPILPAYRGLKPETEDNAKRGAVVLCEREGFVENRVLKIKTHSEIPEYYVVIVEGKLGGILRTNRACMHKFNSKGDVLNPGWGSGAGT
jgi:hypothetical protein